MCCPRYANAIKQAEAAQADAVVLAASPESAALLVNEFSVTATQVPHWFLSPLLKTDLFVQNVAPEAVEGARGVAQQIFDSSADFPRAFGARWQGDQPLEGAYFYYDAMALVALALQRTTIGLDGNADKASFEQALVLAATPKGISVSWNDLGKGLADETAGSSDVYYAGLTGPMLLNSCGLRQIGASTTWTVHN